MRTKNYLIQSAIAILMMEELKADLLKAGYVWRGREWRPPVRPTLLARIRTWLGY